MNNSLPHPIDAKSFALRCAYRMRPQVANEWQKILEEYKKMMDMEKEAAKPQTKQEVKERISALEEELGKRARERTDREAEAAAYAKLMKKEGEDLEQQLRDLEARHAKEHEDLAHRLRTLEKERQKWEEGRQYLEWQLREAEANVERERSERLKQQLEAVDQRSKDRKEIDYLKQLLSEHEARAANEREELKQQLAKQKVAWKAYKQRQAEREERETVARHNLEKEKESLENQLSDDAGRGVTKIQALERKLEEEKRSWEELEKELVELEERDEREREEREVRDRQAKEREEKLDRQLEEEIQRRKALEKELLEGMEREVQHEKLMESERDGLKMQLERLGWERNEFGIQLRRVGSERDELKWRVERLGWERDEFGIQLKKVGSERDELKRRIEGLEQQVGMMVPKGREGDQKLRERARRVMTRRPWSKRDTSQVTD